MAILPVWVVDDWWGPAPELLILITIPTFIRYVFVALQYVTIWTKVWQFQNKYNNKKGKKHIQYTLEQYNKYIQLTFIEHIDQNQRIFVYIITKCMCITLLISILQNFNTNQSKFSIVYDWSDGFWDFPWLRNPCYRCYRWRAFPRCASSCGWSMQSYSGSSYGKRGIGTAEMFPDTCLKWKENEILKNLLKYVTKPFLQNIGTVPYSKSWKCLKQ